MLLRNPKPTESQTLIKLAEATGVFKPGEAGELLGGTLSRFHQGDLGENHHIKVAVLGDSDQPIAWSYFAPSMYADGVWDVWWIGAHPDVHGKGIGRRMLEQIEKEINQSKGRVIIIETSSMPALEKARKFYPKMKYLECGRIPNFFEAGDDKIIFSKTLKV